MGTNKQILLVDPTDMSASHIKKLESSGYIVVVTLNPGKVRILGGEDSGYSFSLCPTCGERVYLRDEIRNSPAVQQGRKRYYCPNGHPIIVKTAKT